MSAPHSPLPWRESNPGAYIADAHGVVVAQCGDGTMIADAENVQTILRAVNSHDDLLAAVKTLLHFAKTDDGWEHGYLASVEAMIAKAEGRAVVQEK